MRNDDTEIVGKGTIHGEQSAGQATQAPAPQAAGTAPPPMVAGRGATPIWITLPPAVARPVMAVQRKHQQS